MREQLKRFVRLVVPCIPPSSVGVATAAVLETEGTIADWGVAGRVWCGGLGPVLEHKWRGAGGGI